MRDALEVVHDHPPFGRLLAFGQLVGGLNRPPAVVGQGAERDVAPFGDVLAVLFDDDQDVALVLVGEDAVSGTSNAG